MKILGQRISEGDIVALALAAVLISNPEVALGIIRVGA